jgi:hypothetical protein
VFKSDDADLVHRTGPRLTHEALCHIHGLMPFQPLWPYRVPMGLMSLKAIRGASVTNVAAGAKLGTAKHAQAREKENCLGVESRRTVAQGVLGTEDRGGQDLGTLKP